MIWQFLICTIVLLGGFAARAAECPLVFSDDREWNEYPEKIIKNGRHYSSSQMCCNNRWSVIVVVSQPLPDTMPEPDKESPPELFWHRKVEAVPEELEAIAIADMRTGRKSCLRIQEELKTISRKDWRIVFESQGVLDVCLFEEADQQPGKAHLCKISLEERSIQHQIMDRSLAFNDQYSVSLGIHSLKDVIPNFTDSCRGSDASSLERAPFCFIDDWKISLDTRFVEIPPYRHYLARGTRRDRFFQCDISIPGKFTLSERFANRDGREVWALSEEVFLSFFQKNDQSLEEIYFPLNNPLSADRIVFCLRTNYRTWKVFSITEGQVRPLWEIPDCEWLWGLVLSENGNVAALRYETSFREEMVIIEITTGKVSPFPVLDTDPEGDYLFLVDVTDNGDVLVKDSGATGLFLGTLQGDLKELLRPIRPVENSEYHKLFPGRAVF